MTVEMESYLHSTTQTKTCQDPGPWARAPINFSVACCPFTELSQVKKLIPICFVLSKAQRKIQKQFKCLILVWSYCCSPEC